MNYLDPHEYSTYGLEPATPEAFVGAASKMIDAHCRRPTLATAQYVEKLRIAAGRNTVRLTYLPLAGASPIVSARGRFAEPRRGEAAEMSIDVARAFSLPGTWSTLDVSQFQFDSATGEVLFPHYVLGLPFNEIEITYSAGFATPPDEVKFACAQLVKNMQATPALTVKSGKIDTMKLDYFADSLIDSSVKALLAPYVAQRLG